MLFNIWMPAAVSSEAFTWENITWRAVEAQHVASTMKVVDTQQEQNILEELLEGNKPSLKIGTEPLHYLLATPFRYDPHRWGSRFRSSTDPGVYYGAESIATACAELGYWRWRFLKDAPALDHIDPVAHTLFRADISTTVVDLRRPPFDVNEPAWTNKTDYSATQQFSKVAREAAIGGIIYKSVRDPNPSWCIALLTPEDFARPRPHPVTQTWWLNVNLTGVNWRRDNESMAFSADRWTP